MIKIKRIISICIVFILLAGLFSVTRFTVSADDAISPKIENGMAAQIIRYSDPMAENYSNQNSDIYRFCTYVETDYDTDFDGKRDLIKVMVQVPKAAVEGKFKAPVIYEADPYAAGMTMSSFESGKGKITDEQLLNPAPKREPNGSSSSQVLAETARQSDWKYTFKSDQNELVYFNNIHNYDYFLVRGFAYVTCAGLGTKGSEGIQACGSRAECEAFKDVVEWLCGKRTAYTDLTSNITVSADWSNNKVGMTGLSYTGTMAHEVATTGVEGLETIVPVAGVSSWYDFTNSQGICTDKKYNYNYTAELSDTCASRFFENYDENAFTCYKNYRNHLESSQIELRGDYGDYWAQRDYSQADKLKTSALIVQGLNDTTVTPKHFDLMWKAFERSGISPKAILHQNVHVYPNNVDERKDVKVGEYTYTEILNRWFSHYLLGADNGVENMAAVTAQSNTDGEFKTYDSWNSDKVFELKPDGTEKQTTVTAKNASEDNSTLADEVFIGKNTPNSAIWKTAITSPVTIKGAVKVDLRLSCDNIDAQNTSVAAALVDVCDKEYNAFDPQYTDIASETITTADYINGEKPYSIVKWKQNKIRKKIISTGIMDLKQPKAGYFPSTAVKQEPPVKSGEWNDYELYLQPTLYTVQPGHRLELYIIPYINGSYGKDVVDIFPPEELWRRFRITPETAVRHMRDYSFTIDNTQSAAEIPIDAQEQTTEETTAAEKNTEITVESTAAAAKPDATSSVGTPDSAVDNTPNNAINTGDSFPAVLTCVVLLLSITAAALLIRKKQIKR